MQSPTILEPEPRWCQGRVQIASGKYLLYDLYYVTADAELAHLLEWLHTRKSVGLDIETKDDLKVWMSAVATLQIGYPYGAQPRAYVLDMRCLSVEALRPLFDVLESRQVMKLGMNLNFECRWLQHFYGLQLRNLADIQQAELVIRAGLFPIGKTEGGTGGSRVAYGQTSMAKLCTRYLGIEIEKDHKLRTSFWYAPLGGHSEEQLQYAAADTLLPYYVAAEQRLERDERGLQDIFKVEFELIPILADAELQGILLDVTQWRVLWQEAEERRLKAQGKLDWICRTLSPQSELFDPDNRPTFKNGRELNYDSPSHVQWALAQFCKSISWPVEIVTTPKRLLELQKEYGKEWMEWKRSKLSPKQRALIKAGGVVIGWDEVPTHLIDEDKHCILVSTKMEILRLAKIKKQLPIEIVDLFIEYSQQSQRASTFGIEFVNKHVNKLTGRVHATFNQSITSTGRITTQPNLQNIPRDERYRACFKPRPGYKYVIADYSQIEPRLSAQVSGDPVYVNTFLENDDIYLRVCEAMTGTYPDLNAADPDVRAQAKVLRQIFKVIVLALAYRMGPVKLRNALILALEKDILAGKVPLPTLEYARELHKRFLDTCSKIKEYQETCTKAATSGRRLHDKYLNAPVTYVTAPCGRKRFFPPNAMGLFTEPPNAPIQGCSATIMKDAAGLVQVEIDARQYDAHVVDLVHDEGVWEVREDQADDFALVVKERMEAAGKRWITTVPVKAEFPKGTHGVVDFWMKELKEAV